MENTVIDVNGQEAAELERATARAEREGVRILARGHRKIDGARIFVVSSAHHALQGYIVAVVGGRLQCECPSRRICKHRALVHAELVREATARTAARVERERATAAVGTTRREDAPLALNTPAVFSLFRGEPVQPRVREAM
jgi:hypothetical protein